MSRSPRADGPLFLTVAATVSVLVATLLPWLRSGSAVRNAYALVRSAAIIGVFDGWTRRICLVVWYALPLLVAATWTAGALRRRKTTALLGGLVGLVSVAAGAIVTTQTTPELGPLVAIVTGVVAVIGAVWLARSREPVTATNERSTR